ncbi:MAG TPA: hypothetical protein VFU74_14830 [Actinocrinis sp.]|nr:hypothetical protein [Actinocrinis sp.]
MRTAARLARPLAVPHLLVTQARELLLHTLVRLGDTTRAEDDLAELGEQDRERGEIRIAVAALQLAKDDPHAAAAALASVLDGSAPPFRWSWLEGLSCWRQSQGTHSATASPRSAPWNAHSILPNPTARSCVPAAAGADPARAPATPR